MTGFPGTASNVLGPLQTALYARIAGDEQLRALTGDWVVDGVARAKVFDQVPEPRKPPKTDLAPPWIVLGDAVSTPAGAHDRHGADTVGTLHVWSTYDGYAQGHAIVDRIFALLHRQRRAITVTGHHVSLLRLERIQPLRDPDPRYRHLPVQYRAITEQERT